MLNPFCLSIIESSQAGEARRMATALAKEIGFDETDAGRVALIASEVAKNLVEHTPGGEMICQSIRRGENLGIEILSLDRGPGIASIHEALRDGYSTGGTAGKGLGAIQRLSDRFDIHSLPERGTAILSRVWPKGTDLPAIDEWEIGRINLPYPGEEFCGDSWAAIPSPGRLLVTVADGLGHGMGAAEASGKAMRVVHENARKSPVELLKVVHPALRGTRGAVMALAEITGSTIQYAGVGNISCAAITSEKSSSMVSHNGTLGLEARKIQGFDYAWSPDSTLVIHSDGLSTQWQLNHYPGLLVKDPSLIAGVLYRDFKRGRDDVTILVVREGSSRFRA